MRKTKKTTKIIKKIKIKSKKKAFNKKGIAGIAIAFILAVTGFFIYQKSNKYVSLYSNESSAETSNVNFTADFTIPGRTLSNSSLYNVVRHPALWGQALNSASYKDDFTKLGTEYIELPLNYTGMNAICSSENVYDYNYLDTMVDDTLAMGFKPFIRFAEMPEWIEPFPTDPKNYMQQQVSVIKDSAKKQKYLEVVKKIMNHLVSKYGTQTQAWAFSSLNEIGVYNPNLAGGDWEKGSQILTDYYLNDFDPLIKSIDPKLKVAGGIECTGSYELKYWIDYLKRTNQLSKLKNADFVAFHHYASWNQSAKTDETLDRATEPDADTLAISNILKQNGLTTEIWESERNFDADHSDPRCESYIGGLFASLSMISNSSNGVDKAFNWPDAGGGFKKWMDLPPSDTYYAASLLSNVVKIKSNATFYAASSGDPETNTYAVKNPDGKLIVISFNRRAAEKSAAYSIKLPDNLSNTNYYVDVYKYSQSRIKDAPQRNGYFGPITPQGWSGAKTLYFPKSLEGYSMNVFVLSPTNDVVNSQFISQSVPATMIAGQTYPVSMVFKNTSTKSTWTSFENYFLGSQNPQDNWNWGMGRVIFSKDSFSSENYIAPGKTKTFNFTITAPAKSGNYNFQWRMLQEGIQWFGEPSTNMVIAVANKVCTPKEVSACKVCNSDGTAWTDDSSKCSSNKICQSGTCVAAKNDSQFVSQSVPSTMIAGQTYPVSVVFKNTGTSTWTDARGFRIGSKNPYDNWNWGMGRVNLSGEDSIAPGKTKTFNFTITAPAKSGNYNFQWRTLQEDIEWFGGSSDNVAVVVANKT